MKSLILLLVLLCSSVARAQFALTPQVTAAGANSLVVKATPGKLYGFTVTNLTATAGFAVVLNAVVAPADGAILPLACLPLPASSTVFANYTPNPAAYNTGVVIVLTSAVTCFTKTTGVITGFISALVD